MSTTPKTTVNTTEHKPLFGGKSTFESKATRGSDSAGGKADSREGAEKAALSGLDSASKTKTDKK